MTRRPASDPVLLALVAVAAALPGTAHAAGGLSIAPARIDAEVRRGALLPPILLRNDTDRRLRIHATVVAAGQSLDGLPVRRPAVDAARRLGRISPAVFSLGPGERRRVRVRVTGDHALRGDGSYGVALFSATDPSETSGRGRSTVATRLRLGTNLLLRFPGAGRATGVATALRAEQAGPRRLRLTVRVRNDGRLHGSPVSRLTVRRAGGREVLRRSFPTGAVLPRAEREFAVTPGRTLPAGDYVGRATVVLGRRRSHRRVRFTLVGPNRLPTPDLQISTLPVPAPRAGEPVRVDLGLRNAGTAAASIEGTASVGPQGGTPAQRRTIGGRPLAPGERRELPLRLDPVGPGAHELIVELRQDGRVVARRTLVFREGRAAGLWDRFRDWAAGHVELLLGGFGILLLLVLLLAAAQMRRMQRRLRAARA